MHGVVLSRVRLPCRQHVANRGGLLHGHVQHWGLGVLYSLPCRHVWVVHGADLGSVHSGLSRGNLWCNKWVELPWVHSTLSSWSVWSDLWPHVLYMLGTLCRGLCLSVGQHVLHSRIVCCWAVQHGWSWGVCCMPQWHVWLPDGSHHFWVLGAVCSWVLWVHLGPGVSHVLWALHRRVHLSGWQHQRHRISVPSWFVQWPWCIRMCPVSCWSVWRHCWYELVIVHWTMQCWVRVSCGVYKRHSSELWPWDVQPRWAWAVYSVPSGEVW